MSTGTTKQKGDLKINLFLDAKIFQRLNDLQKRIFDQYRIELPLPTIVTAAIVDWSKNEPKTEVAEELAMKPFLIGIYLSPEVVAAIDGKSGGNRSQYIRSILVRYLDGQKRISNRGIERKSSKGLPRRGKARRYL